MKLNKLLLIVVSLILSSCAPVEHVRDCVSGVPYGFWSGLWHGFVAIIAFIAHLFGADVAIYAVNNTGGWYNFGYVLGLGVWFSFGRHTNKKG